MQCLLQYVARNRTPAAVAATLLASAGVRSLIMPSFEIFLHCACCALHRYAISFSYFFRALFCLRLLLSIFFTFAVQLWLRKLLLYTYRSVSTGVCGWNCITNSFDCAFVYTYPLHMQIYIYPNENSLCACFGGCGELSLYACLWVQIAFCACRSQLY